jgi:hypothetical protein
MSDPKYDVGYRKPPKEHRFEAGKSGNPRGRPKGAGGFKSDLEAALNAKVSLSENGKTTKITVVAAALKRLIQKAVVQGDLRSIEKVLAYAQQQSLEAPPAPTKLDSDDAQLIADFLARQKGDVA